MIFDSLKA